MGSDATRPLFCAPRSLVGVISIIGRQIVQAPPPTSGPVTAILRAMLEKAEADNHHWDNLALYNFAVLIAKNYDLSADAVLDQICETPGHVPHNAGFPQGLTAVASYLATTLGTDGPPLLATVH